MPSAIASLRFFASIHFAAGVLLAAAPLTSFGQGVNEIIAYSGMAAPGGGGWTFDTFDSVRLGQGGHVLMDTELVLTGGGSALDALITGTGLGIYTEIAREGDAMPDGNGTHFTFSSGSINSAGEVAFFAWAADTAGTGDAFGIVVGDGSGPLIQIARGGQTALGGGTYSTFTSQPEINDNGTVAFGASLNGVPPNANQAVFLRTFSDPLSLVFEVVREQAAAPDANGEFDFFSTASAGSPVVYTTGNDQTVFMGSLRFTSGGLQDNRGIFIGNSSSVVQIVRGGQTVPDGNGSFQVFGAPWANDMGNIVFAGNILGGTGINNDSGIFFGAGSGAGTVLLAREGNAAPDGNGVYGSFYNGFAFNSRPVLNNNDPLQAAFTASFTGTNDGTDDDTAIVRFTAPTTAEVIVREGDATPSGDGVFGGFGGLQMNDEGQIVFLGGGLRDTSQGTGNDFGLFFFDDTTGLHEVVREGDAFLGSTIAGLDLTPLNGNSGTNRSPILNNAGEVAYQFTLADGREGIAVWQMVDPAVDGDLNGDGFVGVEDLDILLAHWGDIAALGGTAIGDASGNGEVGQEDLEIVLAGWGEGTPPGSLIPEPGSAAGIGLLWLLISGRRRKPRAHARD